MQPTLCMKPEHLALQHGASVSYVKAEVVAAARLARPIRPRREVGQRGAVAAAQAHRSVRLYPVPCIDHGDRLARSWSLSTSVAGGKVERIYGVSYRAADDGGLLAAPQQVRETRQRHRFHVRAGQDADHVGAAGAGVAGRVDRGH